MMVDAPFFSLVKQYSSELNASVSVDSVKAEDKYPYQSRDVLAMINAIICCEKCSLLTGQVQSWALEEYVGEKQKIKCDLRCSIAYGSVIDIHFGVTRLKCNTLCAGTAFTMAQKILVSEVTRGKIS